MEVTKNEKKQGPLPNAGQHVGVCFQIISLGTQRGEYLGKPIQSRKIQFGFEFPNIPFHIFDEKKGPQPLAVFQEYTLSLDDKANFKKAIDGWIGQPVIKLGHAEFEKLLGRSCMLMIEHKKSVKNPAITYANIALKGQAIFARPKEMVLPYKGTKNEPVLFDLDQFTWEDFNKLPKFLQDKIRLAVEWPEVIKKHGEQTAAPQAGVAGNIPDSEEEDPF